MTPEVQELLFASEIALVRLEKALLLRRSLTGISEGGMAADVARLLRAIEAVKKKEEAGV